MAGHYINYIACFRVAISDWMAGVEAVGPINILDDFAGGGAMLFEGTLLALLARSLTEIAVLEFRQRREGIGWRSRLVRHV